MVTDARVKKFLQISFEVKYLIFSKRKRRGKSVLVGT